MIADIDRNNLVLCNYQLDRDAVFEIDGDVMKTIELTGEGMKA